MTTTTDFTFDIDLSLPADEQFLGRNMIVERVRTPEPKHACTDGCDPELGCTADCPRAFPDDCDPEPACTDDCDDWREAALRDSIWSERL